MKLLNRLIFPILFIPIIIFVITHRINKKSKHNVVQVENRLRYTLQLTSSNRIEFEKVLTYFHDDSLKQRAARFLIGNMAYNRDNRVGRGITPSPSHTTTHALARGGFS